MRFYKFLPHQFTDGEKLHRQDINKNVGSDDNFEKKKKTTTRTRKLVSK